MRSTDRFHDVATIEARIENGSLTPGDAELAHKDLETLEENGLVPPDQARLIKVQLMGLMR